MNTLKWDKRISWSLMYYFIASAVNYTIKSVFLISGSLWNLISLVIGVSIVIMLLISFREVYKRSSKQLLILYAIFSFLYLVSTIMCSSRGEPLNLLKEVAITTLVFYIPVGVYAVSVYDKQILYDVMLKASNVLFVLMAFRALANYGIGYTENEELEYSMSFGYILVVPTLFHFNEYIKNKKKVYLFLFILEVLGVVIFASRGVLLSIWTFIFYKLLISSKSTASKFYYTLLFVAIAVVVVLWGDSLLHGTINLLNSIGINSRTLNMLEADAIDSDSGRNYLYKISYDLIQERPFFGLGLGGEYYSFANIMGQTFPNTACSSHNGVLQAMVQFGIIGGVLASLIIVYPIFGIKRIQDFYLKDIIAIYFFAFAIPALTISSGFFVQPQIAIFLCLYYFREKPARLY